jgi:alpha-amylase/alpha-mannosidase (GH57 family)
MNKRNKYVCIHGHFYQPPRENAWLETIEQQESARPFHDWNTRINHECYAPNATARILDREGWIVKIRNNYSRISWNFGPTLLSWLEEHDPVTYALLQAADQRSIERFSGHGSAIAQVHSHLIMPLCNNRDKVTQVRWGVRDFEYRFGRYPEGIWLAESAVDTETLEVLASENIKYTVLAPRQAKAVRKMGETEWQTVHAETIDSRRPYWCVLPSGGRIALFFYHGAAAQGVAFDGLLNNGKAFSQRLLSILDTGPEAQLAHIATDGESYGHHHRFGEMALADALNDIEYNTSAQLTNYGQYLELEPPTWEVQIHENSSWSCVHGVERWRSDCGCNSGGRPGWRQIWRKPLRDTLNWLRDRLIPLYEQEVGRFVRDPWAARNDYIDVMLHKHKSEKVEKFFTQHARRPLSALERVAVLRLLEMQRHCILMFTSCGWFFDEISGIETNQILQYALRAMDYANDIAGISLHNEFTRRLSEAPSNVFPNGAASYLQNVVPTKVSLDRVAMHFAVASLFEENPADLDLFNYTATVDFFDKIEAGTPKLAVGRLNIRSRVTMAEKNFSFAVLYLGQQHIIGNISGTINRAVFDDMYKRTAQAFKAANLGEVIGILQKYFGPDKFTLASLLSDEKSKIIRAITDQSLQLAESNFRNVFNDNYQLMTGLQEANLPLPDAWHNIAAYVINADLLAFFENGHTRGVAALGRIAEDMRRWNIKLNDEEAVRHAIGERIRREIEQFNSENLPTLRIEWLNEVLTIVYSMNLKPSVWRSQNLLYLTLRGYRKGEWVFADRKLEKATMRLADLLKVRIQQPAATSV